MGRNVPRVEIELDRTRYMTLTFKVGKKFKEITGKSLLDMSSGFGVEEASTLIWLMLLDDDPELTQDQADEFLDFARLPEYTEKIGELMGTSSSEGEGEPPKETGTSTG
jgi:hypothetical protein